MKRDTSHGWKRRQFIYALLPHRRDFQSEEVAAILDSAVLSDVSHQASDFRVSSRNRVVLLACRPHFRRAVAAQFDPERASSIIPDYVDSDSDSARHVRVYDEVGSSAADIPAEGIPRTDAAVRKLPALLPVPFASYSTDSKVAFASRLHCWNR